MRCVIVLFVWTSLVDNPLQDHIDRFTSVLSQFISLFLIGLLTVNVADGEGVAPWQRVQTLLCVEPHFAEIV